MHIDDWSHVSSMTPPSPPTSPPLCSTQASPTSPMGGSTVQTTSTQTASGAHTWDTPRSGAPRSPNVSFAMVLAILRHTAAICTSAAEMDESVEYRTTTPASPIPHALPMLGRLDDRRDVKWGVMS